MMRLWKFHADMNFDNVVTISDAFLWFKWLYFYPGDWLLSKLFDSAPSFTRFFELNVYDFGGWFSGITSSVVWFILLPLVLSDDSVEESQDAVAARLNEKKIKAEERAKGVWYKREPSWWVVLPAVCVSFAFFYYKVG